MGAAYQILGKSVLPHQLALGTIGLVALLVVPNPFSAKKSKTVEFNSSSKEEEQFINEYITKHSKTAEKH